MTKITKFMAIRRMRARIKLDEIAIYNTPYENTKAIIKHSIARKKRMIKYLLKLKTETIAYTNTCMKFNIKG